MRNNLFCFFMLVYSLANAQDSVYIDTKNILLDEMVVAANRWEQNLQEVPGKVLTISKDFINLYNPQTTADLLAVSNGVFIQKSQLGGGSPMIRGFATNRVLLVVDGVRMNNAIFRSGNVQNVISLDANAIQEAEVLFGPGAVIYGSDAIGGVMDFHTLQPKLSKHDRFSVSTNALTRYASANQEKTVHTDVNIALQKWAFLSSITWADYDDLRMGSQGSNRYTRPDYVVRENDEDVIQINKDPNRQVGSGYDQMNAMQKILFQPSSSLNVTYAFHYSKTSDNGRYDRLILREQNSLANAEWYYGPQKWMMHALTTTYTQPVALADQARLTLAYQHYEESRHNRGFKSERRTNRFEKVKALSINLDLDKKLNERITLFYGAELVTNEVGSTAYTTNVRSNEVTPTSTRYPDGADWRTYAAYISAKVKFNKRWLMNVSTRYTNFYTHAEFDKTFFDFPFEETTLKNKALNGALGFIYTPSAAWKVYSNFSTGFRAPNVDDIGKVFDSEPGNVVIPNQKLDAEFAYNAEIGVAHVFCHRLKFDGAAYYTSIDNAIARGTATFNGLDSIVYDGELSRVLSLQNISKMYVYGIQIELSYQILQHLKITSSINYQRGKEKDAETNQSFSPTHVAPLFGSTHILFINKKIKADLFALYNGAIDFNNLALSERADSHLYALDQNGNPYSPKWWTLNVKGAFVLTKIFTINAGVENILDKRYRPYSSGIASSGRNFIIGLRAHF